MKYLTALLLAAATTTAWADMTNVSVPGNVSKGVKETVATAWPKAVKACPGFKKYEGDLSFKGVEDNYSYAPDNAKRIEVIFKVSESPKQIPSAYRAFGHTCYFSLSPDGSTLSISKSSCASVCADQSGLNGDFAKKL